MIERTAKVRLLNQSGRPIEWAAVVHKFSDVYQDCRVWPDPILVDQCSPSEEALDIRFYTASSWLELRTATDWWKVLWVEAGNTSLRFTEPTNGRWVADTLEGGVGSFLLQKEPKQPETRLQRRTRPGDASDRPKGAKAVAVVMLNQILRKGEATSGFKQHILREGDDFKTIDVVLKPNSEVLIVAPSGEASAAVGGRTVPSDWADPDAAEGPAFDAWADLPGV